MEIKFTGILYSEVAALRATKIRFATESSLKFKVRLVRALSAAMVLFGFVWIAFDTAPTGLPFSILAILLGSIFLWIVQTLPRRMARGAARDSILFREPAQGVLTEDLIRVDRSSSSTTFEWKRFLAADVDADLMLLWIDTSGYLPLPRTIFANEEDWRAAKVFIQRRFKPRSEQGGQ